MHDPYVIRVYSPENQLLRALGVVQSARYRLAENEVGDWEVTVPYGDGTIPNLLQAPNRVEFYRSGVFVFGGVVRRQEIRQDGRAPFYTVSGPSYMQWLADCRMYPGRAGGTGTGDIVYAADNLDDIMKTIVTQQVANTSFAVTAHSGLSAVSEAYTATAYETVLETLQAIGTRAKDTTFDIVRDTDDILRFRTWTPSRGPDRSKGTASPVLFDLYGGNLIDAEWVRDGNTVVNALWTGGPGDKASRYIYPPTTALTNAQSILDWGRIEGFFDAGNETTVAVPKKAQEELDKVSLGEESVSFKVAPFGRYRLGEDFDFATRVTVVWPPILEFTDVIRGIEVSMNSGEGVVQVDINVGDTITGDQQTRAALTLGKYLRSLRRSISVQTRH